MRINLYLEKASYSIASLGIGIVTLNRFLNTTNLVNDIFKCHDKYNRCQMPIYQFIEEIVVIASTSYASYKFAKLVIAKEERRYIPRTLRPVELPKPVKHPEEISAFHPGTKDQVSSTGKRYIYDSLDSLET